MLDEPVDTVDDEISKLESEKQALLLEVSKQHADHDI